MNYTSKQTKNSPFLKVRRNITSMPEMADLLNEEGSTGFGTYMMILIYLTKCDNCVGLYNKSSLRSLSVEAHKSLSYICNIINNYGLFVVDDKIFYSQELCQTLNIDFTVNSSSSEDELELKHSSNSKCKTSNYTSKKGANELTSNPIENDSKLNHKSNQIESRLNHESIRNQRNGNKHNTYTHAQPREDIDIDINKDKRNSSSTTTNSQKDDVIANVSSSSDSIKKSFADAEWVKSISGVTCLDLTDKTVAEACIEWFGMQCVAKGKTFDTDENARWYFCNLLQQGRKTREAFDEYYKQYKYDEMVRKTALECCEDDYYDYKENGRRYDICHQIIPPDAPRQIDPNTTWSWIKLKFIPIDEFKGKPEMVARSKYYEEYRRTHNKQ